jgi:serine/threonine-protein kinase RsbW
MVNAVVHGNRYSKNKKVRLSIELEGGRLTVVITDEGEGYNPEDVPDPLAEENLLRSSGRGLLLIKAFVDEFKIRPTPPGGTEVTLIKYRNSE